MRVADELVAEAVALDAAADEAGLQRQLESFDRLPVVERARRAQQVEREAVAGERGDLEDAPARRAEPLDPLDHRVAYRRRNGQAPIGGGVVVGGFPASFGVDAQLAGVEQVAQGLEQEVRIAVRRLLQPRGEALAATAARQLAHQLQRVVGAERHQRHAQEQAAALEAAHRIAGRDAPGVLERTRRDEQGDVTGRVARAAVGEMGDQGEGRLVGPLGVVDPDAAAGPGEVVEGLAERVEEALPSRHRRRRGRRHRLLLRRGRQRVGGAGGTTRRERRLALGRQRRQQARHFAPVVGAEAVEAGQPLGRFEQRAQRLGDGMQRRLAGDRLAADGDRRSRAQDLLRQARLADAGFAFEQDGSDGCRARAAAPSRPRGRRTAPRRGAAPRRRDAAPATTAARASGSARRGRPSPATARCRARRAAPGGSAPRRRARAGARRADGAGA